MGGGDAAGGFLGVRTRQLWGAYRPDQPPHLQDGLTQADGVYAAANGYRPVKAFSEVVGAIPQPFNGAAGFINTDGDSVLLAGGDTRLYIRSGSSWSSIYGPATFGGRWHFTQFSDTVVATNGGDVVAVDILAGTAAVLGGTPPTADLCCTVRDFVFLGRTDSNVHMVTWSGFNDATSWTAGDNLSGFQPMLAGGKIMGIVGGEFALILQRYRIVRVTFTGDGAGPFQFDEIETNIGCRAEGSVAQSGPFTWFLSDKGFCQCDGTRVVQIGAEVFDAEFAGLHDENQINAMWACADPARSLVVWCVGNKLWLYNWVLQRMTTATLSAASVFPIFTTGLTIEDLDAIYGDLDGVSLSLDDPSLKGGYPRLGVVNADGDIGVLDGANLQATLQACYVELADSQVTRLRFIHPLTDATSGVTMTMETVPQLGGAVTSTTSTTLERNGNMIVRAQGRYGRVKQVIAAGTAWEYTTGVVFDYAGGGGR